MRPGERCDEIVRLIDAALEDPQMSDLHPSGRDSEMLPPCPGTKRFSPGPIHAK